MTVEETLGFAPEDGRRRTDPLRIHGAIAQKLGVDILSGRYQPHDVLPNEIAFSEALKVSRTAYREAVRILAAKGLVESRPKAGTRVTARRNWNLLDPDILAWSFESEPSEAFVSGLFELRLIVEPAAAALAAARRDEIHLRRMRAALKVMERETLAVEAGRKADIEFHNALMDATRNAPLASLSSGIAAAVHWTTHYKQRNHGLTRDPIPEHIRVYDAIAASDASEARWRMETLVRLALEDTRQSMG